MQGKTDREIFEEVKKSLNFEKAKYEISEKSMNITTKEGYEYTLTGDGNIYDEKVAILDIAEGNIDLYSTGYKQYTGAIQGLNKNGATPYTGKYIITGTTTENVVRVCDVGNYDIIIKDLNIDVSSKTNVCAFNANRGSKATDCYVNLILEGNNSLYGGMAPGLGFVNATPNIDGVTNGSTLTIEGNGYLVANSSLYGAAIGSGYTGWESSNGTVSNIIINSGNISANNLNTNGHGAAIGGGLYSNVNNIIINGGNINVRGRGFCCAIGGSNNAENIVINGGNIRAYASWSNSGIGGTNGSVKITGGNIFSTGSTWNGYEKSAIGYNSTMVTIEGGTIKTDSPKHTGIFKGENTNVKITGGNLLLGGIGDIGTLNSDKQFVQGYAKNNESNVYKTQIKLQNIGENKKIESLTTSDGTQYGVNDMYTLEDGMLYMYLPLGKREITIKVDGKTYKGEVETKEESGITLLNEI